MKLSNRIAKIASLRCRPGFEDRFCFLGDDRKSMTDISRELKAMMLGANEPSPGDVTDGAQDIEGNINNL